MKYSFKVRTAQNCDLPHIFAVLIFDYTMQYENFLHTKITSYTVPNSTRTIERNISILFKEIMVSIVSLNWSIQKVLSV